MRHVGDKRQVGVEDPVESVRSHGSCTSTTAPLYLAPGGSCTVFVDGVGVDSLSDMVIVVNRIEMSNKRGKSRDASRSVR